MVAVVKNDLLICLDMIARIDLTAKQSIFGVIWKWTAKDSVKKRQLHDLEAKLVEIR